MNRRIGIIVAVAVALALGLVAAPRRYVVDGVSMGPGLLPGDVVATGWLPGLDRWRPPGRFDRWIVTLPDGSMGLKRAVGLPGEALALAAGDLVIDGRTVLKGPRVLAEVGSVVDEAAAGGTAWSAPPAVVLDEAPFALAEPSRLLLPVRDGGFAAELEVQAAPVRVRAAAGPLAVTWRLGRPGRYAVAAGRLDGHAVAAAWLLPAGSPRSGPPRRCLPPGPPEAWSVARPWPDGGPPGRQGEDRSPALAVDLLGSADRPAVIGRVVLWRDVFHRPAADGRSRWRLGPDEVFLMGDFPSGSRDSRHFGPLAGAALRHRLPPR